MIDMFGASVVSEHFFVLSIMYSICDTLSQITFLIEDSEKEILREDLEFVMGIKLPKERPIFESLKIPFVGAGVAGASVTMDKVLTKKILEADGIPVTDYLILWKNNDILTEPQRITDSVYEALKFPVFVKPSNSGSSIGITKVKNTENLPSAIKKAFKYSEKILIAVLHRAYVNEFKRYGEVYFLKRDERIWKKILEEVSKKLEQALKQ